MFAIEVQSTFSAAHALRLPDGAMEPFHGHDFHVAVRIAAEELDEMQTVADFHDVEAALNAIIAPWRNRNLNDLEPFRSKVNPSAERIAEQIGKHLGSRFTPPTGRTPGASNSWKCASPRHPIASPSGRRLPPFSDHFPPILVP